MFPKYWNFDLNILQEEYYIIYFIKNTIHVTYRSVLRADLFLMLLVLENETILLDLNRVPTFFSTDVSGPGLLTGQPWQWHL